MNLDRAFLAAVLGGPDLADACIAAASGGGSSGGIAAAAPGYGLTAWSLVAYTARGEVRHLWNASPAAAPAAIELCDQGWVWRIDLCDVYPAPFYVPQTGSMILMSDGLRLVPVRVSSHLAAVFAERRARREADRVVLAPRGGA